MRIIQSVLGLLYPADCVCLGCGCPRVDDIPTQLCAACREKLRPMEPPLCPRCGRHADGVCETCLRYPHASLQSRGYAAFAYAGMGGALVRALKFQQVRAAAQPLALGLLAQIPSEGYDALVPVPLHKRRERIRGFNQARCIAEAMAEAGGPPILDALVKRRATRKQSSLDAEGRQRNVRDAYVLCRPVSGMRLLLVDDVRTTGATLAACAEILYAGGATLVSPAVATAALQKDGQ